ncbi:MAG: S8 family serine peptidase [Verrucomicrobia bacterium]|nr:S8 family serine peptidase [Verrucomicrobiota bacterium]
MDTPLWLTHEQAAAALHTGRGAGVKVAVIDSGVEVSHPWLSGLQLADDFAVVDNGLQLEVEPGGGVDLFGHGTGIAAIIRRLAPEATIGSFRVLGARLNSKTAIIREGVRLALERGYQVLNCSFGCGLEQHLLQYKQWIDEAYLMGVHIVAACNNYDFTKPEWPGYFPSVVTVNFARAEAEETFYYRPGNLVEFAARGDDIEVAWKDGGTKKATGSSYAAPHVAGLLARLLSVHPGLPPLQAKALLHIQAERWSAEVAGSNVLL